MKRSTVAKRKNIKPLVCISPIGELVSFRYLGEASDVIGISRFAIRYRFRKKVNEKPARNGWIFIDAKEFKNGS